MSKICEETKIIGQNLKKLRVECGVTQRELAHLLSVSFQQINKYEKGINRLPIEKMYLFARAYRIPYDLFFTGLSVAENDEENALEIYRHMFEKMPKLILEQKMFHIARLINTV